MMDHSGHPPSPFKRFDPTAVISSTSTKERREPKRAQLVLIVDGEKLGATASDSVIPNI